MSNWVVYKTTQIEIFTIIQSKNNFYTTIEREVGDPQGISVILVNRSSYSEAVLFESSNLIFFWWWLLGRNEEGGDGDDEDQEELHFPGIKCGPNN